MSHSLYIVPSIFSLRTLSVIRESTHTGVRCPKAMSRTRTRTRRVINIDARCKIVILLRTSDYVGIAKYSLKKEHYTLSTICWLLHTANWTLNTACWTLLCILLTVLHTYSMVYWEEGCTLCITTKQQPPTDTLHPATAPSPAPAPAKVKKVKGKLEKVERRSWW